ncbi:probable transmembrane protein [Chromobacterium violaceum ATCC 12472]|uniref:Probable transmembrane protein n=1 Tax=Chromobacterium violaceum (strain ATCC 12472 / DSM 30191 / JCM 1249 / CCUG 213 / NBRC 12614 / NCIMB 9131 / NCTC 9757 / MK) TaxID=243365 RepID=Q7NUD5_CHRVO|nr:probable transmembrane protein [Chromobacterium violaceum ATCC 12472]
MGDIRVSSRLGERLAAELPLLGGAFDKSEQLRVSILPDPSQGAAMKEQLSLVASITHQLDRSTDGRRMLLLSSSQPITQARLSFRVEVVAGNVRAQKTYSLALDGAAAQGSEQARAAAKPEPKSAPRQAAEHALDGKVYHVNKGDTLSAIAMRVRGHARGEDVAGRLLRDNPDAFIRGDANRLLAGAELRYPASWAMRDAVDREEGGRPEAAAKPGSMAKLLAEGHQADQAKSASSRTEAHPEAKPAAAPAVKPEAKAVAKPAVKAASSPAALAAERRMRDLLMKQDQALKQTEQRAKALEEQIRALQQTKSKPEADEAPASPTARKQEADVSAKPAPAEPKPAIAKPEAPAAKREEHPSPPVGFMPAASAPQAPPQLAQPVERKPEPAAQAKPQAERGVAAEAMAALSDRDVLIKLGGAAAALGLVALLLMRRRRAAAEGGESAGHADGGDQSATMQLKPLTSLMSSLKKGEGIDLDSVDVMAEVEVYLAYGRQDQALLILREGLDKEPQRQDLRYKLLEVLASQSDKAAFIEEAATAKRMFGKDSTMWQRVCELGRAAAPDHPLFEREAGAEPPSASLTAAAPEPRPAVSAPPPGPAAAPAPPSVPPADPAPAAPPAAASAVVEEDAEKMELAKLYMEMGDKETAELLMREAQHGR